MSGAQEQIKAGSGDTKVTKSVESRGGNGTDKMKDDESQSPRSMAEGVGEMKARQNEVMPDVGNEGDPGEEAARGQAMTNVPEAQDALA